MNMRAIPILETERLLLRAHDLSDLPRCIEMWSDPAVTRYTIGAPSPNQRTWLRILAYLGHWSLLGYGYWAVVEKKSGLYVGELGFADFKRELDPSINGFPELGWALMSDAHGKGYATEALKEVVRWGDVKFGSSPTVCIIKAENTASIRVAEKLGFSEFKKLESSGATQLLFSRH